MVLLQIKQQQQSCRRPNEVRGRNVKLKNKKKSFVSIDGDDCDDDYDGCNDDDDDDELSLPVIYLSFGL